MRCPRIERRVTNQRLGKRVPNRTRGPLWRASQCLDERRVLIDRQCLRPRRSRQVAAKLIALDPSLKPAETVQLILDGADEVTEGDHVMHVINPKRSAELLAEQRGVSL